MISKVFQLLHNFCLLLLIEGQFYDALPLALHWVPLLFLLPQILDRHVVQFSHLTRAQFAILVFWDGVFIWNYVYFVLLYIVIAWHLLIKHRHILEEFAQVVFEFWRLELDAFYQTRARINIEYLFVRFPYFFGRFFKFSFINGVNNEVVADLLLQSSLNCLLLLIFTVDARATMARRRQADRRLRLFML